MDAGGTWTYWQNHRQARTAKPGAGVNKDLPPVGDLYITGVVNVGGFMDYLVLQNTRLYLITV